ncbi:MAG: ABC transporter ATP-binding protein [Flavobacteriales bacterium]|nr:ABC transporter ATP-binding protein [Flavobacteriales bacterium]
MTPLLQVDQLEVAFERTVISGVSFNVYEGMTTAIVGESGSGKTVTSTAIMGLLPSHGCVTKGHVKGVDGVTWVEADKKPITPVGRAISMVFQDPMSSLNPSMKVGEQVSEPLVVHMGLDRSDSMKRVLALFKEVELPEPETAIYKYPHELSGGQKQRVMLAIALACDPMILVADEPTTALDVTVQKTILELLLRLQKERDLGILFITHDLDVVRDIADFIVVMKDGEIVEQGECHAILDSPTHPYTLDLLNAKPKRNVGQFEHINKEAPPFIEVKDLDLSYITKQSWFGKVKERFTAVKGVNLKILPGERLGLVGESGCGKSTLGRLMLGLEIPNGGSVIWKGVELDLNNRQMMQAFRRDAQPVFQDPFSALNPRMSIGAALCEAIGTTENSEALSQSKKMEMARNLLVEVGLSGADTDKYPASFSGGMRQRIVLARALAVKPALLILDESVSALDVRIQAQILTLLSDIQKRRSLAYLFISHDLNVIHAVCDRVIVMKDGEIIEEGSAEKIFNSASHSYTKHLLESRPGRSKLTA